jgi:hypothetical protein
VFPSFTPIAAVKEALAGDGTTSAVASADATPTGDGASPLLFESPALQPSTRAAATYIVALKIFALFTAKLLVEDRVTGR